MSKINCYDCKFRGLVAGSTHSSCHYGDNETNPMDLFSEKNIANAGNLDIIAQQHGIKSGWFNWPIDFDPIWLVNCDGFMQK